MAAALYPGTFDPITYGHLDLVCRARGIFDRLIILIAANPAKVPLFSLEERIQMAREQVAEAHGVEVRGFYGLLAAEARSLGVMTVIRGLRAVADFEREFGMALMNRRLEPDFESVFLMPSQDYIFLRSSLVKEVAKLGGDVSAFVPPAVTERLRMKLGVISPGGGT